MTSKAIVHFDEKLLNLEAEVALKERNEQVAAQIAALSCDIPSMAIKTSIKSIIMARRKKLKTRYDYNQERVRDLFYNKKDDKAPSVDALVDQINKHGKVMYSLLSEPTPYMRNYSFKSYESFTKQVDNHLASFEKLQILDFSGLKLGDARLVDICDRIYRSPLHTLNLTNNNITDDGLLTLSKILRNFRSIRSLLLAENDFSDTGVGYLVDPINYSPTLETINLSRNALGIKTAYFLGTMFQHEKVANLKALFLGGRIGKNSWGDDFVRVLIAGILQPGCRPLVQLSIPDAGLTSDGISALATLLICSNDLQWLNISKNAMNTESSKSLFKLALCINSSLKDLFIGRCGLTSMERSALFRARDAFYPLMWSERTFLGVFIERELAAFEKMRYVVKLKILNSWNEAAPLPFPNISEVLRTIPRENISLIDTEKTTPLEFRNRLADSVLMQRFVVFLSACITDCNAILADCAEGMIYRANEKAILEAESNVNHWKRLRQSRQVIMRTVLNRYIAYMNSAKNPAIPANWSKASKNKVTIDIDTVHMAIEDFRATQVEVCVNLEMHISELFKCIVMTRRAISDNTDKPTDSANDVLAALIPYYTKLDAAALYTHYIYVFDPAEKERQRLQVLEDDRRAQVAAMVEARNAKRALKTKPIIGRRFHIGRRGDADYEVRGGDDSVSSPSRKAYEFSFKKKVVVSAMQKQLEQMILDSSENDAQVATIDDAFDQDDELSGKNKIKLRSKTKFLVAKREMQNRYQDLTMLELEDRTCEVDFSRGTRRFAVGCHRVYIAPASGATLMAEEELDRGEPLTILNNLNVVRPHIKLKTRMLERRERHYVGSQGSRSR